MGEEIWEGGEEEREEEGKSKLVMEVGRGGEEGGLLTPSSSQPVTERGEPKRSLKQETGRGRWQAEDLKEKRDRTPFFSFSFTFSPLQRRPLAFLSLFGFCLFSK